MEVKISNKKQEEDVKSNKMEKNQEALLANIVMAAAVTDIMGCMGTDFLFCVCQHRFMLGCSL